MSKSVKWRKQPLKDFRGEGSHLWEVTRKSPVNKEKVVMQLQFLVSASLPFPVLGRHDYRWRFPLSVNVLLKGNFS